MIQLKRVYDEARPQDGRRILIERLWPRGIKKTALKFDAWVKEAGPSHALRRWFGHDPAKWDEFQRRYFAELDSKHEVWEPILKVAAKGPVTLLYSSHDTIHNNAVTLKEYLESRMSTRKRELAHAHSHAA